MANSSKILLNSQRVLGAMYCLAGVLKFSPFPEDVAAVLRQMAAANAGTWLAVPSDWLAAHPMVVKVWVGLAMTLAGIVYLRNRGPVRAAAIGLSIMLLCFIVFLFRSHGVLVVASDTILVIINILIIRGHARSLRQDSPTRSQANELDHAVTLGGN